MVARRCPIEDILCQGSARRHLLMAFPISLDEGLKADAASMFMNMDMDDGVGGERGLRNRCFSPILLGGEDAAYK